MKAVLLDAGMIVALLDRSERHYRQRVAVAEKLERALLTCRAGIAESCYLLRRMAGAGQTVLENAESGIFQIPFQLLQSAASVRRLLRKHRGVTADFADACLIHPAVELDTGDILTLDRDFQSYRWRRSRPFHLLVDLEE